jgi:hypothetical protein
MRSGQTQLNRFRSLQQYRPRTTTPIHISHLFGTLAGSSGMAWPQFDVVYKIGITLSVAKRLAVILNLHPSLKTCYFAKYG